jgi:hypothetical protein
MRDREKQFRKRGTSETTYMLRMLCKTRITGRHTLYNMGSKTSSKLWANGRGIFSIQFVLSWGHLKKRLKTIKQLISITI